MIKNRKYGLFIILFTMLFLCLEKMAIAMDSSLSDPQATSSKAISKTNAIDRSGKIRKGKASYYGRKFYGKKMANGKSLDPQSNVAASKILPLGTKAKVTNLDTGKSAVVDIEDRGPYVPGRIVDLSPQTAEKLDIKKDGVAPVEVKPLVVPNKEDDVKHDAITSVK
jgi:rare lipoprotein A